MLRVESQPVAYPCMVCQHQLTPTVHAWQSCQYQFRLVYAIWYLPVELSQLQAEPYQQIDKLDGVFLLQCILPTVSMERSSLLKLHT